MVSEDPVQLQIVVTFEKVPKAITYQVEIFSEENEINSKNQTDTTYTAKNLTPGQNYKMKITSISATGRGPTASKRFLTGSISQKNL